MTSAVVWFSSKVIPECNVTTILWDQYLPENGALAQAYSLPKIVHEDTNRWKRTYLDWLAGIGNSSIDGASLIDHLSIRNNLSYWWLTLPTEFSLSQEAIAYKAVRIWALVELAERLGISEIELVNANSDVTAVLSSWCENTGRRISIRPLPRVRSRRFFRRDSTGSSSGVLVQIFLATCTAVCRLGAYIVSLRHRIKPSSDPTADLTIVDYFTNFTIDEATSARYSSNYWSSLPERLAAKGIRVHWVHIDVRSTFSPNISTARKLIGMLNENEATQCHSLLQDMITPVTFFQILRQYLVIVWKGMSTRKVITRWNYAGANLDMWPVVKLPWRRSFYGAQAIQNATWLCLFEAVLDKASKSGTCLYLMENQPWELALISNWNSSELGAIIGVQHSSVRHWDFRFALGGSGLQVQSKSDLPQPHFVFANGPVAIEVLTDNGFPKEILHPVEALRYLEAGKSFDAIAREVERETSVTKLLALGEYDTRLADSQVALLNELMEERGSSVDITFRPHPASSGSLKVLDDRIHRSFSKDINADLARCDVAFCSNVSTASTDAILARVPAIIFLDGSVFDGQIRDTNARVNVTNFQELVAAIDGFARGTMRFPTSVEEVFFSDSELPLWNEFLSTLE